MTSIGTAFCAEEEGTVQINPRLPSPGFMLVDCKACKTGKTIKARKGGPDQLCGWGCSSCGRLWRFDGDTQEWSLRGHHFPMEEND